MRYVEDPGELTPEQRLEELARILARGYRRLLRAQACARTPPGPAAVQVADGLDSQPLKSVNPLTARESESGGGEPWR